MTKIPPSINNDFAPISIFFDLCYLLSIINSQFIIHLHPELQRQCWTQARLQIQVPSTSEILHEFMLAIDAIEIQKLAIQTTLTTLLEQVEKLVEAVYNEQGDSTKMDVISNLREKNKGAELF